MERTPINILEHNFFLNYLFMSYIYIYIYIYICTHYARKWYKMKMSKDFIKNFWTEFLSLHLAAIP